ncbi:MULTISPECIES: extracellular solute-binding protein [Paenibacillus]|uniref:extracellular solute-binding protein n=1 Tax=Paenibacillus TaxID=44249 RepID=UPI0022B8694D|nr:extracellular solute-binding protein [Paenibacillus caseinilyticus]MCZ8520867.1 extracellular solute-binding protein [Paenibacillus caseinilyticus]
MMKKRALTTITAFGMLSAALLSGCSADEAAPGTQDGPAGKEASTGPVTFSYFVFTPGDNVPESTKIGDLIEKKTGVKIKYELLVGEKEQKLGVMIAGGDYPDLINSDMTTKMVDAKALIPLEELIEKHAPNIKRVYGPYWERLKSSDGHIYSLPPVAPTGTPSKGISAAFWIQKEVLKEAGFPKITTFEQYVDILKAYYKKHPQIDGADTVPFEILTYDWRNFTLTTAMQFLAGGPNDSRAMVKPGTSELTFYQTDEKITKRYYEKLNEMYNEGMIDKEAFVMNYEQYLAKLSSGRVLGMFDQKWQFQQALDSLKQQGKENRMFVPLQLTFDESIKADYLDVPGLNYNTGFSITVNCKDPVRAIQYADFMASDEGQILRNWGVKGEDFKVSDKGRFYRDEELRKHFQDPKNGLKLNGNIMFFWPGSSGTMPDGNNYEIYRQPEEIAAGYDELDKEILKVYGAATYEDTFNPPNMQRKYFPLWSIELSDKAKVFDQKIGDLNKKFPPQMVVAKSKADFEKSWSEYVQSVNKLDVSGWMGELSAKVKERQEQW